MADKYRIGAREYLIGIPVATVIFLVLTVAAYRTLFTTMPGVADLRAESLAVYTLVRERAVAFIPPTNDDPMTPNMAVESDEQNVIIRVYGLISPERQRDLLAIVRTARDELETRPVTVYFYYPLEVPLNDRGEPLAPTVETSPEPFRVERVTR
jgi:hypothetical protein